MPWNTPFAKVQWLVCDSLNSDCEFEWELQLVEHHVVDAERPQVIPDDPVGKLLTQTSPIVETADSRRWQVRFDYAVAFRSESESFSFKQHWPEPEVRSATYILEDSPWIEEIGEELLGELVPGCRHYVIFTSHVIIEVISPNEPVVS